jgi:hypothetical protein
MKSNKRDSGAETIIGVIDGPVARSAKQSSGHKPRKPETGSAESIN